MSTTAAAPARRGRPCGVCSLGSEQRTALESALAAGTSIASISRQSWAPGRDSIRFHVRAGHLPQQLQETVERVTGLDSTTIAARLVDNARRARVSALEAAESSDHAALARANDGELRALAALSSIGVESERSVELNEMFRDTTRALLLAARRDPGVAEAVAAELYDLNRGELAEDLLDQVSETKGVSA